MTPIGMSISTSALTHRTVDQPVKSSVGVIVERFFIGLVAFFGKKNETCNITISHRAKMKAPE